ncbi:DUF4398 domain-containing protein [Candidatus Poribacteria bacterium]|nr:DUF4398 domain-containing protein [Gemmatimonadales bacterium]MYC77629.1 DUF4398 domain-containing protein [Candidatus Poribacteria bacterium]
MHPMVLVHALSPQGKIKKTIWFIVLTVVLGCGGQLQQLAVETMENAQVALSSANAMGAQETADTPLRTAQEMLVTAENAMNAGDVEQAYRLALRAYLHARIATEIAIAIREEANAQEVQAQLTLAEQNVDEVLQRLEAMKVELQALQNR